MKTIDKYLVLGLVLMLLLTVIYSLFIRNQRDHAINKLDIANGQINGLIKTNLDLKGSIDLLERQDQQNRVYITTLEAKRAETEKQASKLSHDFKVKRHENQTINDWANQPLPSGLY